MDALGAKYNLAKQKEYESEEIDEIEDDEEDGMMSYQSGDEEIINLKKENINLRSKLQEKEKEIKHLKLVISNLEVMPCLTDVVADLQEQVKLLTNGQKCYVSEKENSTLLWPSSATSTPKSSADSDAESEMINLCPNIVLTKGQHKAIKSKSNLKQFVYSIMGMLWSRDILCTHSITGKPSNAFKEKGAKPQLDQEKVKDICEYGAKRFGCKEAEVRQVMTTRINNVVKVEKEKKENRTVINGHLDTV